MPDSDSYHNDIQNDEWELLKMAKTAMTHSRLTPEIKKNAAQQDR
jgi:hypothetical protein